MGTFVAGYIVVWLSLTCYVGWIGTRQRRLAKRFEILQQQIETASPSDREVSRAA